MNYSDKEINDFLELAQEVGITRAKRELGYPASWGTAQRWADLRGVEVNADAIMAKAAQAREWYKTEDILIIAQEGFSRVYQDLTEIETLTADEQKKLSEAGTKWYGIWANAQGKANNITETRETDTMDAHLAELIANEKAKNINKREGNTIKD